MDFATVDFLAAGVVFLAGVDLAGVALEAVVTVDFFAAACSACFFWAVVIFLTGV